MSVVIGESGDGVIWEEWEKRDFPARESSTVDATFQSIVPASQQHYFHARVSYTPLCRARAVSSNDDKSDEKSLSGTWDASVSANRDNQGNANYDVSANVQTKTESGFEFEIGGGLEVRQDRDGNVKTEVHSHASVKGSF